LQQIKNRDRGAITTEAKEDGLDRDDLELVDHIFDTLEIDNDGRVDIEKVRNVVSANSDNSNGGRRKALAAKLKGKTGSLDWTEFLPSLKCWMKEEKEFVKGELLSKKETTEEKKEEEKEALEKLSKDQRVELLRMFNRMDPNGDGYVDMDEFRTYIMEQRMIWSYRRVEKLFNAIRDTTKMESAENEAKGITFMDLVVYFRKHGVSHLVGKDSVDSPNHQEEGRWKPFEVFNRESSEGEPVLTSPDGIVQDFLPGVYDFHSIVKFSDLPPIKPASTIIEGVRWEDGDLDGEGHKRPGKLHFPLDFNGEIFTELATTETLHHYGASLAESTRGEQVELAARQCLDDFTYAPNYLSKWVEMSAGGAGLEQHGFAHLDCPFERIGESGYYVLAKFNDEERTELEITAFQVPRRHTVFTPAMVIHTNNYLRGCWRTMLSDDPVNEVKLHRGEEQFTFKMKSPEWI